MSFKEWLPKTERNKMAFTFAHFSLFLFLAWNFMPIEPERWSGHSDRIFAAYFWRLISDPRIYMSVFKSPDFEGMLGFAVICAALVTSAMSLLMIPFWRQLHATPVIRVPVAAITLVGALMLSGLMMSTSGGGMELLDAAFGLLAINMFFVSLAMFTFENELGWKPRPLDPRVPRRES